MGYLLFYQLRLVPRLSQQLHAEDDPIHVVPRAGEYDGAQGAYRRIHGCAGVGIDPGDILPKLVFEIPVHCSDFNCSQYCVVAGPAYGVELIGRSQCEDSFVDPGEPFTACLIDPVITLQELLDIGLP